MATRPDINGSEPDSRGRSRINGRDSERNERFEGLFASYGSDIVAYCGWRTVSASDAQDAVAETFLTAWRRIDEVPDGDAARVWLYATARRVLANQRRASLRRAALQERLTVDASRPQPSPVDAGETLVHEALRSLGPRDREVLLLAEWEGLSAPQIAAVLGCLTGTARGRLHRARRRFRAAYEELAGGGNEQSVLASAVRSVEGGP